ncbi:MAG: hypothetical protein ACRENS_05695 [Candidatus Eiseniibacteriota bacterium]
MIFIATKNDSGPSGFARLLLAGFMLVFAVGVLHITLESLGLWQKLPSGLVTAIDVGTGLVLLFELVGHLGILTWKAKLSS